MFVVPLMNTDMLLEYDVQLLHSLWYHRQWKLDYYQCWQQSSNLRRWLTFPSACCNKLNGSIQHRYEVFNASSINIMSEPLYILKHQPCTALHGHTPPQNPPGKNNPPKHAKSAHISGRKWLSYALKIKLWLVRYGLWGWLKGNRLTKLEVSSFFLLARSVMFSPL